MTTDTKTIREEIARKGPGWAAQEIAWLRRMLAVSQSGETPNDTAEIFEAAGLVRSNGRWVDPRASDYARESRSQK